VPQPRDPAHPRTESPFMVSFENRVVDHPVSYQSSQEGLVLGQFSYLWPPPLTSLNGPCPSLVIIFMGTTSVFQVVYKHVPNEE